MIAALRNIYDKQYKVLLVLSFLLLFTMCGVLIYKYATTGEFVNKGVSLKGGLAVTIPGASVETGELQTFLSGRFPSSDLNVRESGEFGQTDVIVEASDVDSDLLLAAIEEKISFTRADVTVETVGSSLGASFFSQTIKALLIAFVSMGIVVFLTFRSGLPTLFVILAAVSDIVSTLAVVSLLDIRLSTAGIAAFLMLIGYSVDTDILLTARVLKRSEGTVLDRTLGAMKTGLLMTGTALTATIVGYVVTQSEVIRQIMLILSIGLLFDVIYTWIQNAGILRLYMERKYGKAERTAH